ncbi:hypothetical protein [Streptomyces scabichelini]|uniref:hypothetical protein n=1 Tax=Streptomyces scabichelini TaxID=2711217 RepID=UPI0019CFCF41|nr:hypothetical protein [Streptomyces scabichelini]
MTSATRHALWTVAAATVLALTGACGDGDDGAPPTPRPSATDSPGPTAGSTSPSISQSPTPTGTAPEDPEEAEEEIREAWRVLFDPQSSLDERADAVEHGEENALMIRNLFADPRGKDLRADVSAVTYASSLYADVDYTLTRDSRRLGNDAPGAAVLQDDTWKVALNTVCALTQHAKDAPKAPACP